MNVPNPSFPPHSPRARMAALQDQINELHGVVVKLVEKVDPKAAAEIEPAKAEASNTPLIDMSAQVTALTDQVNAVLGS